VNRRPRDGRTQADTARRSNDPQIRAPVRPRPYQQPANCRIPAPANKQQFARLGRQATVRVRRKAHTQTSHPGHKDTQPTALDGAVGQAGKSHA
jgi:hypothetical protein